jgi:hypothetical protein
MEQRTLREMITYLGVCLREYLVDISKDATLRNLYILDFRGSPGANRGPGNFKETLGMGY